MYVTEEDNGNGLILYFFTCVDGLKFRRWLSERFGLQFDGRNHLSRLGTYFVQSSHKWECLHCCCSWEPLFQAWRWHQKLVVKPWFVDCLIHFRCFLSSYMLMSFCCTVIWNHYIPPHPNEHVVKKYLHIMTPPGRNKTMCKVNHENSVQCKHIV